MYSVVIPVYQAKDCLKRCVESWLSQTRKDLELILVDDGSTDGSERICEEMAANHHRIHVVHQKNTGVSAARNKGIQVAKGEFLLFTDSDDYVMPDYLEKMAKLQQKEDSDLVLCGFHHLYNGADIVKLPGETATFYLEQFAKEFLLLYEKSFLNMPWNKLYRRNLAGSFDTSLSLGEDLLFNLQYLKKCKKISVLGEALCCYLQEEQKTTLSSKKRANRLELAKRLCKETEKFYQDCWKKEPGEKIFNRYMNEVLDECEKLPLDKNLPYKGKLKIIHDYANDDWVKIRGDRAVLNHLDYRILWFFLKRDRPKTVYMLCVLRRIVVVIVYRFRQFCRNGAEKGQIWSH